MNVIGFLLRDDGDKRDVRFCRRRVVDSLKYMGMLKASCFVGNRGFVYG